MQKKPAVPPAGSEGAGRPPQLDRQPTTHAEKRQDGRQPLLIGSLAGNRERWPCCPWATTVHAWSAALNCEILIAQECKRWGCNVCGRKRSTHLAKRVELAKPNRLITFTTWTLAYPTPREAYDGTRRALRQVVAKLRRRYTEFEYLRVLERHKNGYPHYHCVVRSPYIPQKELSELWAELTMSPIVDVRKIKQRDRVYYYVMKYLAKQSHIPWTNRRVAWSRNFFRDDGWTPPDTLKLSGREWHDLHPSDYAATLDQTKALMPLSNNAWKIGTELELLTAAYADAISSRGEETTADTPDEQCQQPRDAAAGRRPAPTADDDAATEPPTQPSRRSRAQTPTDQPPAADVTRRHFNEFVREFRTNPQNHKGTDR